MNDTNETNEIDSVVEVELELDEELELDVELERNYGELLRRLGDIDPETTNFRYLYWSVPADQYVEALGLMRRLMWGKVVQYFTHTHFWCGPVCVEVRPGEQMYVAGA